VIKRRNVLVSHGFLKKRLVIIAGFPMVSTNKSRFILYVLSVVYKWSIA